MTLWLENGTKAALSELRVQNCVMLGALKTFEQGTNDNKMFRSPYAVAFNERRDRWVITGWEQTQRCWETNDAHVFMPTRDSGLSTRPTSRAFRMAILL